MHIFTTLAKHPHHFRGKSFQSVTRTVQTTKVEQPTRKTQHNRT